MSEKDDKGCRETREDKKVRDRRAGEQERETENEKDKDSAGESISIPFHAEHGQKNMELLAWTLTPTYTRQQKQKQLRRLKGVFFFERREWGYEDIEETCISM